ncbi:NAD(P)-dependent dehydrogenase (short-subunit alcohol dehydrogenase family) [Lipingzhangella halophila]|uniref:NAD(P)-dependent dehydrogenase (Short-subunit alcohol dehydrogenase family) n=1 Tax=Lipingzhangella halophila TaxID=1783352 RepID=A0A7W7RCS2_9ACTN|nr:SDR family NAD(P)-dependent oxidoreductase [Lipingzhangella halophila]MBB4929627.1 NAD(P)-dependent dehydrogenase (short-subunit alcohol dehydrogenase family) [Lipingzhangella halophila]
MTTTARGDRVWFITGASRGLGRAFAEAALGAGDRVAIAARDADALREVAAPHAGRVLDLPLDVTDRDAVNAAMDRAVDHFGRLDVVVNNAGTLSMGAVEEFTEDEARHQMEVNFFGALWVSQAAVRRLRMRGEGHIVQVSSIGALAGYASCGMYSASKFALEGMSEALAMEAASFGVRVSIVQPGGYWTELYDRMRTAPPLEAYAPMRAELERQWSGPEAESVDSEPHLAAEAVLRLVDSDDPPSRLLLGSMVYDLAFDVSRKRMDTWARWEQVSRAAEHAVPAPGGAAHS